MTGTSSAEECGKMMQQIRVTLDKRDKLIISLPEPMDGRRQAGASQAARVRIKRCLSRQHRRRGPRRAAAATARRPSQVTRGEPAGAQASWEQALGDRVRMIEMHAF